MAHEYDLVILGGGTAGYVAAVKASQLGLKTAVVEKAKLGGTCLHKGCIPTKSMLKSAEVITMMKQAEKFGIDSHTPSFKISNIIERKNGVVDKMYNGVKHLMKKNGVDVFEGTGRILGPSIFSPMAGTVSVEHPDDTEGESEILVNQNVLISTGSVPRELPFLPFDSKIVLSSDDMMTLSEVPKSFGIIGGGVIGLEFASLMSDLGSDVTVIEAGSQIIPEEDKDIADTLKKSLEEKGISFKVGTSLSEEDITLNKNNADIKVEDSTLHFDKILVAVGRKANIDDVGLQNTKAVVKDGVVETNDYYQTKDNHIYAVGDCIGHLQLAHAATKEAITAVEHMAGKEPYPLSYHNVPRCIYTSLEVAAIGYTVKELKHKNIAHEVHKVPLAAIGKAVIGSDGKGFGKIMTDPATKDILGVELIGEHVTELINEVSFAKFVDASALELGSSVHAHPSISEVLMELGLDAEGAAIHV
jgi:dihydrolipoamide dehydrogenase